MQMYGAKAIALAGTFAVTVVATASATPLAPSLASEHATNIVQVSGGCGWGWHPNRWGRCVPNRYYGSYHPHWYRPSYSWHAPNDFVANDLNRRQVGRYPWY